LVVMEATGVYWKPVFYALEDSFEVWLCNAQHVKNVPGRKSDMSDAEWLADVAAHGMVRASFVPPLAIRELRELTRYRKTQIDARVAEIQRLEKLLQDAGIKLTSVASKVLTQSGRLMVEALIAGQRDPAALAQLAKGKLRPKIPQLTEALAGHFGAHHAVAAAQVLAHIDCLDASIAALTEQIGIRMRPYAAARMLLEQIPGFDRLVIDTVIAETGADMARFPTAGHLAAWSGGCPGNYESAGKRRRGRCHAGQSVAAPNADRGRPRGRAQQGQLLRRPVPPDRQAARPEQGRRRGRPQPVRPHLAHAHHRRVLHRPRRRLLPASP
jgi:Transposase IS116/IS110/IS902 family./Transposase.